MNAVLKPNQITDYSTGYAVDPMRGSSNGALSSQWSSRPADQRYTSLASIYDATRARSDRSLARTVQTRDLRVVASMDDNERLRIVHPEVEGEIAPNHWSFGQLASQISAPAGYLRSLPAGLAAINVQYGLQANRSELVKMYSDRENLELRAVTGPDYGRVHDHELIHGLIKLNEYSGGRWKVPGTIDWSTLIYRPAEAVTKESTTLYASDRDCFLFLCDDLNPIEVGKLANGDPDLMFRGIMAWNSETGAKTLGVSCFYLRAVCQNRNLWGVEGYQEIKIRHSKNAPIRLGQELFPALRSFSEGSTAKLIEGVAQAKAQIIGSTDESVSEFLAKQSFTRPTIKAVMATVLREEDHPARSVWDVVQGLTAHARTIEYQDERVTLERAAGRLLDRVA